MIDLVFYAVSWLAGATALHIVADASYVFKEPFAVERKVGVRPVTMQLPSDKGMLAALGVTATCDIEGVAVGFGAIEDLSPERAKRRQVFGPVGGTNVRMSQPSNEDLRELLTPSDGVLVFLHTKRCEGKPDVHLTQVLFVHPNNIGNTVPDNAVFPAFNYVTQVKAVSMLESSYAEVSRLLRDGGFTQVLADLESARPTWIPKEDLYPTVFPKAAPVTPPAEEGQSN